MNLQDKSEGSNLTLSGVYASRSSLVSQSHGHINKWVMIQTAGLHYSSQSSQSCHLQRGKLSTRRHCCILMSITGTVVFWDGSSNRGHIVSALLLHITFAEYQNSSFALSLMMTEGDSGKVTVTINEHVKYFYSSGVEKYPCEFWPALLLFCMMLCFEINAS